MLGPPGPCCDVRGKCPALLHVVRRSTASFALRPVLSGQRESQDEALQSLETWGARFVCEAEAGKLCDARVDSWAGFETEFQPIVSVIRAQEYLKWTRLEFTSSYVFTS